MGEIADWPVYYKALLKVGNKDSNVGIVTLWTKYEFITDKLDSSKYAVAGQLYSKNGINYIIRNIFANPKIRYLVVCGQERSSSGKALFALKESGVNEKNEIIGVENALIDDEIPKEAIELFRKNIELIDLRGINDSAQITAAIDRLERRDAFATPRLFKDRVMKPADVFPSDKTVFKVTGKTFGETWLKLLAKIMKFGHLSKLSDDPYTLKELFCLNSVVLAEDPDSLKLEEYFPFTKEDLENYLPQLMTAKSFEGIKYTYGQRLRDHDGVDQIDYIVSKLKEKHDSKTAVAVLWNVAKDAYGQKRPCLISLFCLITEGSLQMNVFIRSNDMFNAWLLNAIALRKVQKEIAEKIGVQMGPLTITSGSAHIYDYNWEDTKELLMKYYKPDCEFDPQGNLAIKLENGEINVTHLSPDGIVLQEFKGRTAKEVFWQLHINDVISSPHHAMDIGYQLANAELALKKGTRFIQDQPLDFDQKR